MPGEQDNIVETPNSPYINGKRNSELMFKARRFVTDLYKLDKAINNTAVKDQLDKVINKDGLTINPGSVSNWLANLRQGRDILKSGRPINYLDGKLNKDTLLKAREATCQIYSMSPEMPIDTVIAQINKDFYDENQKTISPANIKNWWSRLKNGKLEIGGAKIVQKPAPPIPETAQLSESHRSTDSLIKLTQELLTEAGFENDNDARLIMDFAKSLSRIIIKIRLQAAELKIWKTLAAKINDEAKSSLPIDK